jgi:hypothetical protein
VRADAIVIGPETTPELHAAFAAVMRDMDADDAVCRGDLPDAGELAERAADDDRHDVLSDETRRLARRFKHCRWRAAALLTLRRWSAWLAYCFAWAVRHLANFEDDRARVPWRYRRFALPTYDPPPRDLTARRVVRRLPRTGPPVGQARIGACAVMSP